MLDARRRLAARSWVEPGRGTIGQRGRRTGWRRIVAGAVVTGLLICMCPAVSEARASAAGRNFSAGKAILAAAIAAGAMFAAMVLPGLLDRSSPLKFRPKEIDVGVLRGGTEIQRSLVVNNESKQSVTIEELSLSGRGLTLASGPTLPSVVEGKDTASIQVTVRVSAPGRFSGKLAFVTRASGEKKSRRYEIPIRGELAQP